MSTKATSPTAHILRNSRFFALPRPLPIPATGLGREIASNRISETATLPHPIQQAIATTPSSLQLGDWGLKRPLPLRATTNTSTPLLRINAVDTREHITDFSSAADLSISLQKIQELNLPVTSSSHRTGGSAQRRQVNVFEAQIDNTDREAVAAEPQKKRWKFKGPWVAGMTPGDFATYVEKQLRPRRAEFMAFVRARAPEQILAERRVTARQTGGEANTTVTEQDVEEHILKLRNEYDLNSPLARLVAEFLDLPDTNRTGSDFLDNYKAINEGPPTTHPSAGLSYLRSDAFLDNHPLFGPQANHAPVEARNLGGITRFSIASKTSPNPIGVAGVVASPPRGPGTRQRSIPPAPDNSNPAEVRDRNGSGIGLGTPGGSRIWVSPTKLEIDAQGRARLETANPSQTTIGVHTGQLMAPDLPAAPKRDPLGLRGAPKMQPTVTRPGTTQANPKRGRYGIGPKNGMDSTADLIRSLTKELDIREDES